AVTSLDDNLVSSSSAAGFDLVYISESVSSGRIGTKLTNASVPIISSESYLFDDLGLTGSALQTDYGNANGVAIEVANPAHPILDGLSGSLITIYADHDNIGWGIPANNNHVIATVPGDSSQAAIMAYARGETLANGQSAPAARIALPIWNAPTHQLLTILENAMDWAIAQNGIPAVAESFEWSIEREWLSNRIRTGKEQTQTVLPEMSSESIDRLFATKGRLAS
ncbi:MAG: hypothetical protein KDA87_23280, partial [Planctomycetales bacterium]|nr:hypothetical protein [Planctomycetales bacterium]